MGGTVFELCNMRFSNVKHFCLFRLMIMTLCNERKDPSSSLERPLEQVKGAKCHPVLKSWINSLRPSDTWISPSHYLNQNWNIVNWTLRNKLPWNFHQNSYLFIKENAYENVIYECRPFCLGLNVLTTVQCGCKLFKTVQPHQQHVWSIFDIICQKRKITPSGTHTVP